MFQMRISRDLLLAAALTIFGSHLAFAATGDPKKAEKVVSHARTKAELSSFIGGAPHSCLQATPKMEICEWHAGDRLPGWEPIAEAIQTSDRIALLCELPSDGGPRMADSCFAYPRRSNRGNYRINRRTKGQPLGAYTKKKSELRSQASEMLDRAHDMVELSVLVGAVPVACKPAADTDQTCNWLATKNTRGHGTLAVSIGAALGKKISMNCVLPNDGSPRAPGSCVVAAVE
jgi:hypothetical protein